MCFSTQIEDDYTLIAKRFSSKIDQVEWRKIHKLIEFQATPDGAQKLKETLGFKRIRPKFLSLPKEQRIYPNTFAPVIVMENNELLIRPMRYRIRPNGSKEEIPTRYNVFNARRDSLTQRKSWKGLLMKNHGLFPFKKFFEWVEVNGKKQLISFSPDQPWMWAPCLFDYWEKDGIGFYSFALITDDPPEEIQRHGHDRCPIFFQEENIKPWLKKEGSWKDMDALFDFREKVHYEGMLAA